MNLKLVKKVLNLGTMGGFILLGSSIAAPQRVILIRHADKTIPNSFLYSLNRKGFKRSIKLASMILGCFGTPDQIWVYPFNTDNGKHARSYQTSIPLAIAAKLNPVFAPNFQKGSFQIGNMIQKLSPDKYKLIVLIWRHSYMQELASGLGWPGMKSIANNDFDRLYEFSYRSSTSAPVVTVSSQDKLFSQACSQDPSNLKLLVYDE